MCNLTSPNTLNSEHLQNSSCLRHLFSHAPKFQARTKETDTEFRINTDCNAIEEIALRKPDSSYSRKHKKPLETKD